MHERQINDSATMTLTFPPTGRTVELAIAGEIDMLTQPSLAAQLQELAARRVDVTLDLSDVTFMDSAGVHLVLTAMSTAEQRGCVVRMSRMSPPAERVATLCGGFGPAAPA